MGEAFEDIARLAAGTTDGGGLTGGACVIL